jgi:HPt (histidine-containing phosphotransfer) domain-containing protein
MFKGEYCDLSYIYSICDDDESFIREMIQTFLSDSPGLTDNMKKFSDLGEWKKVGDLAHKFKTSLMFMGINSLHDSIRKVEFSGRNNIETESIPNLVSEISIISSKAIEELKTCLSGLT